MQARRKPFRFKGLRGSLRFLDGTYPYFDGSLLAQAFPCHFERREKSMYVGIVHVDLSFVEVTRTSLREQYSYAGGQALQDGGEQMAFFSTNRPSRWDGWGHLGAGFATDGLCLWHKMITNCIRQICSVSPFTSWLFPKFIGKNIFIQPQPKI